MCVGVFTDKAIDVLHEYARGIPRVACSVADLALLVAFSEGRLEIDDSDVRTACQDLDGSKCCFHYFKFSVPGTLACKVKNFIF